MWTPYEKIRNRKPDFLVEYQFIPPEEGGLPQLPFQGVRADFKYDGDDVQNDGNYMIHPEFLNEDGRIILDDNVAIPPAGRAYMWIAFFEKMWNYHRQRATPGRHCWFVCGSKKLAQATVIEQIGLIHQIDHPVWIPGSDDNAEKQTTP